jgi:hypothetical protein
MESLSGIETKLFITECLQEPLSIKWNPDQSAIKN